MYTYGAPWRLRVRVRVRVRVKSEPFSVSQVAPQAAPSSGQPRPICRLGRAGTPGDLRRGIDVGARQQWHHRADGAAVEVDEVASHLGWRVRVGVGVRVRVRARVRVRVIGV